MKVNVFGCGAAGNKALDCLVSDGFDVNSVCFINSTAKDIYDAYKDRSIIFGAHRSGGCGKERTLGKKLLINDMKNGTIDIDKFIDDDSDLAILVSSTEGGSGSASLPILAKYIHDVHEIPVICIMFFGFGDDPRGLQNTIEVCQELSEAYGTIIIPNGYYYQKSNKKKLVAEAEANRQFVECVRMLVAAGINPSSQNIDDTDLLKVITTPGYMTINEVNIGFKIKNTSQYESLITEALDDSYAPEASKKSAKRIAIFFSTVDNNEFIDYNGSIFKDRFGNPYEFFTHIQMDMTRDNSFGFVRWIVSGQKMPMDEIQNIYQSYMVQSDTVDKEEDSFFDNVSKLRGNMEDNMFNMMAPKKKAVADTKALKSSFFKGFEDEDESDNTSTKKGKKKSDTSSDEEY